MPGRESGIFGDDGTGDRWIELSDPKPASTPDLSPEQQRMRDALRAGGSPLIEAQIVDATGELPVQDMPS